jgi:serine phosphatase RsbU (regulator of sigma subunit)
VVYAERAIPADGRSRVDRDSAFTDIDYAIYLGETTAPKALTTSNVDPEALPFAKPTGTASVPIGDTVLTLVTHPRRHLGSPLSQQLPLILLLIGPVLTVVAFIISRLLIRRRQRAEDSAAVAIGLSERLQRALLPLAVPKVPDLEVAVEYVAGARGVDIGGDWYSIIALDTDDFAFVVGDVSGKGIDAVAVMARARFTLRAYLLRGDRPDVALSMAAGQFDVTEDGHIVTVMVGVGNWRTGEVTVANAGHCKPLLLRGTGPVFLDVATGLPLGAGSVAYAATSFTMDSGDLLFCYTDGLIERRTEDIDVGMRRLARVVAGVAHTSVAEVVAHTVQTLRSDQAEDDVAVLAFRRTPDHDRAGTQELDR